MDFINRLYTKIIFTEDSSLNAVAKDMGELQIQVSMSDDIVRRLRAATGTVGSLSIYVPVQVNLSILKTSPLYEVYQMRALKNGYIGGTMTVYDDVNKGWTISDPSIGSADFPASNGSDPQVTIRIDGNLLVNTEALAGIS